MPQISEYAPAMRASAPSVTAQRVPRVGSTDPPAASYRFDLYPHDLADLVDQLA